MSPQSKKSELVFLPLGGCGEIGMNLNLYGLGPAHDRKWIIADLGVMFGTPQTPGIEIIMPDTAFLEDQSDRILAIILTHAHEDHMGGLARLWPRLRCPVYATPFTKWLVDNRLEEAGLIDDVPVHEISLKERFQVGDFDIELITLTHSIPEPNALAIRTSLGTVLHTGDWKIDPDPQIGEAVDALALKALGDEGVLAIVCDSTNVFTLGHAGSEAGVRTELTHLIGEYDKRGVAVASFASNVARMESVLYAAKENERRVCLIGRSMHRMAQAALACDLLEFADVLIDEQEAEYLPSKKLLYLCTGSQGENRAALSRIADGSHRTVKFVPGDVVIFSSKIIPGNEKQIFALQNRLAGQGVEIVTEKDRPVHVSGHPCRDELKQMYEWARPLISIPVHGERRHLQEHARLARELGIKHALAPYNGEVIKLASSGPQIIDEVPNGRLHEDGGQIISADDRSLKERRKMAYAGHVCIGIAINKKGQLVEGPEPRAFGFVHGEAGEILDNFLDELAYEAEKAFHAIRKKDKTNEDEVEDKIRAQIRRYVRDKTGKRAIVDVIALKV